MAVVRPVLLVIGLLLATLAIAEMLPVVYDLSAGNPDWIAFALSATFTFFVGIALVTANWGAEKALSIQQAFVLTVGAWVALTVFGAIPFVLSSLQLSFADAVFEAMSAITTTGATVISGLDKQPPGILIWRALLQWLGGLGVIVMAIAVLPMLKVGGMHLFRVEAFDTAGKILPRATQISGSLTIIYAAITLACGIAYVLAGMPAFDATVHAMTTVATGGMSSRDASIGYYDSAAIEFVSIVFMIIGSLPFLLYVRALRGRPLLLVQDSQVRWFFGFVFVFTLLAWMSQATGGHEVGALELRDAMFSVVSIMTGTGYVTVDYSAWSTFAVALFFCITFIGGCSGSTSCGIKVFRFQVLFESIKHTSATYLYPNRVFIPRYNGRRIPADVMRSVGNFFFAFFASFVLIAIALSLQGLDAVTALSATATAMANVGPGLGEVVGPAGNFAPLPDGAKWLLTFAMLLGRLEVFTVLALLVPSFWLR